MFSLEIADHRRTLAVLILSVAVIGVTYAITPPVTIAAVILACLTTLAVISPAGSVAACVFTLPYFYHPLNLASAQFAASEILLVAAAGGTSMRIVVNLVQRPRSIRALLGTVSSLLDSRVVIAAMLLVILGAVTTVFPYNPEYRAESLREWRWTLVEPAVLVALLAYNRRVRHLQPIVALSFLAGASVAAALGLADLIGNGGVAVEGVTRITGPYPHPNALALITARALALALAWAAFERRLRPYLVPLAALSGAAVIATLSRGAFAATGVAVAFMAVRFGARFRSITVVIAAGLGLLLTAVAGGRMSNVLEGGSGSLRLAIWSSSLDMIRDRPIVGYGPDQFLYAYAPRYIQPEAWSERFTSHAHNIFFDFWIRLGIIGGAFACTVAFVSAIAAIRVMRRPERVNALKAASSVALIASLMHGLVDNAYFSHDLAMSGWLLAWLTFGVRHDETAEGVVNGARPGCGRRGIHRIALVRQLAG